MIANALERRPDIDWLRVLATLLVIVFHVAMVFNPAPFYHVRNDQLSFAMLVFCGFVGLWHMPLFFVLAGWSLARSLGARRTTDVVRDRVARLAVPLVAGIVLFMPSIKFLELKSGLDLNHRGLRVSEELLPGFREVIPTGLPVMPEFRESFAEFVPTFFTNTDRFTWSHLWFVAYLLTFTLVLLPLLVRWAGAARSSFPLRAWMVWAPVPLLAVIQLVLRPHWPGIQNLYDDWANVAWYTTYFLCGFALGHDPRLESLLHAQWKRAATIGLATCLVLLGGITGLYDSPPVLLAGSAVAGWAFVVTLLGLARARLSFSTPALSYLAEAALPLYLVHQAAIVVPGFWLLQLPVGIAAKFGLLLAVAFALTFATYHLVVRPLTPLRVLFGMRPLSCGLRPVRAVATGAAVVVLLQAADHTAQAAPSPIGLWYAEGGAAQVEIRACGDAICGRVVWLRSPFDEHGCGLSDAHNPDQGLRGRPVLGIDILEGLRPLPEGGWDAGSIYDPTTGRTYSCSAELDGNDRLLVRGYLGFRLLGRTTTWIRVGREDRTCRASEPGL